MALGDSYFSSNKPDLFYLPVHAQNNSTTSLDDEGYVDLRAHLVWTALAGLEMAESPGELLRP